MIVSVYSTAGKRKRLNEDAYLLRIASCGDHLRGIAAVCDGVSSLDQGQSASRFVIEGLNRMFEKWKLGEIAAGTEIRKIHEQLCEKGKQARLRFGTTCSVFLFEDDSYQLYQVGDSRIYLYEDCLRQLTVDQTLARVKYDAHTISLEEYQHSHEQHVLTQCMGITEDLEIVADRGRWHRESAVMVCSDGIFQRIAERSLERYIRSFLMTGDQTSAKQLADEALKQGENDNLTALLYSRGKSL